MARGLPGGAGDALAEAARSAFVDGFALAGAVSAGVAVAAGAFFLLPRTSSGPAPEAIEAHGDMVDVRDMPAPAVAASGGDR